MAIPEEKELEGKRFLRGEISIARPFTAWSSMRYQTKLACQWCRLLPCVTQAFA
jgi:hypothetical protein